MELRQIQYFLQLYWDCNMTKSSKALFISQQGLSKSISKLEEELGFLLFQRSSIGSFLQNLRISCMILLRKFRILFMS